MNNKPVAWMNAHGQFNKKETWLFPIPLYTHPAEHDLGIAEAIGFEKGYQAGLKKAQE